MTSRRLLLVALGVLVLALPAAVEAQPFGTPGGYLLVGPGDGYVEVPSHPSLTPERQVTIEFWGALGYRDGCDSLFTKSFTLWVGVCNGELRSYLRSFREPCQIGKML